MWTRRGVIAIAATLAAAMTCAPGGGDPASTTRAEVGVSLALTGPDARWGVAMLQGVELAVEEVNRGGGAGGRPLEPSSWTARARGSRASRAGAGSNNYERAHCRPDGAGRVGPQTSGEGRGVAAP